MLQNLLLTDFFPGVRSDAAYRPIICQRRRALKGAPVVWGVSAAVSAAFESALLAGVEEFPGPEAVACSGAADVGALLPRRTPLVAVPDDTGNGAGLTAPPAERARPSAAGNTAQASDLVLLTQVLQGLPHLD
jgi:hypothetical protein